MPVKVFILLCAIGWLAACGAPATATLSPTDTPEPATPTILPTDTLAPSTPTALPTDTLTPPTATAPPVNTPAPDTSPDTFIEVPLWRYVNSGWVSPYGAVQTAAFTQELRAFVITTQSELDRFEGGFDMKRSMGTSTSLERADFSESVLLAAYYLWRPLQGDPLSVVGFSLEGNRADVLLELEEAAQGKEYPYLFAPMIMVAVDRSQFPPGEPVDFVFYLNDELLARVMATVE